MKENIRKQAPSLAVLALTLAAIALLGACGRGAIVPRLADTLQGTPGRLLGTPIPLKTRTPTPTRRAILVGTPLVGVSTPFTGIATPWPPRTDSCGVFRRIDISAVLQSVSPGGAASTMYFSFPGGIPGIERSDPQRQGEWRYSASIWNTQARVCEKRGIPERLFCDFDLPASYANTVHPLRLMLDGCDRPAFRGKADISVGTVTQDDEPAACNPDTASKATSEGACTAAGGTWIQAVAGNRCECQ